MPRGKRVSKKIHDKKKSNPKRNIRKSKKGGKTSIDQVKQVISDMNNFLQSILNDIDSIYPDKSDIFINLNSYKGLTRLDNLGQRGNKHKDEVCKYMNEPKNIKTINNLIKEIGKIVGGHVTGIRMVGVQECSSFKNMNEYFQCEENKIDQYKEIGELCDVYSSIYRVCGNPTSVTIKSYASIFIALENNAKKLQARHEMKLNNQSEKYNEYKADLQKEQEEQQAEQQAQQQAQEKFNKEEKNYEQIIGNDLWPIRERYKRAEVVFFHEKNNEMVKLGTIKSSSQNLSYLGSGGLYVNNYYVTFSKEINSGTEDTKDTKISIGGPPAPRSELGVESSRQGLIIPLYYEKGIYNDELQDAAKSIEKEEHEKKKLKEEKMQMQEEERQQQEEELRKQEEQEYNNADTVDKKIAIRLKYNKEYQYLLSRIEDLSRYKVDSAAYQGIPEKEKEKEKIKEKITKQEKEKEKIKEENKKFQAYLSKKADEESDYIRRLHERQKLENEKNAAAAIQPGGKRRSRKKRNMKKSKKGKSKNRR